MQYSLVDTVHPLRLISSKAFRALYDGDIIHYSERERKRICMFSPPVLLHIVWGYPCCMSLSTVLLDILIHCKQYVVVLTSLCG